ncbi:hypothetical protein Daus18300_007382 [Diaporthe australafricana]|uniref:Uncharacterized protein n=1 Tax=Diaporthe australafricana TaxID=127596 RepID=A0ABR3WNM5_9PEZI
MHAPTSILLVAGLVSTAFAAAHTYQFSDEACNDQIAEETYSGANSGDVPILDNAKSIKVDSFADPWYAYQDNDGESCKGDLITKIDEDNGCIKVADLGIGCTRLCSGGLGGGNCASTQA